MSSIREKLGLNNNEDNNQTSSIREKLGITKKSLEDEKNDIELQQRIKEENSKTQVTRKTTGLKWIDANLNNIDDRTYQNAVELSDYQKNKTGGTILNTLSELGKGVGDFAESVGDTMLQIGSSKYNPFMHLLYNGDVDDGQKIAQEIIQEDSSQKFFDETLGYQKVQSNGKTLQQNLDENSYIKSDNLGGTIARGIGNMLPSIALGNAGAGNIGSMLSMGINSYGSGIDEAYDGGATRTQANLYGLGNAAIETATEWVTGGIPGVQKVGQIAKNTKLGKVANFINKLNLDTIADKGLDKVSNKIVKEILNAGYKMVGEGTEEVLSELLSPILKNATYSSGEKVNGNAVLQSFLAGAITGGILEAPINVSNIKSGIAKQSQINANKQSNVRQNLGLETNTQGVENTENLNYNINEGDTNGQRNILPNNGQSIENDSRGTGGISYDSGMATISSRSSEGNVSENRGNSIAEGYQTREQREQYLNYAKNNLVQPFNNEMEEIKNIASELGVETNFFKGTDNGSFLGTVNDNKIYLDSNTIQDGSTLKNRFYHELFHYIKRNPNLSFDFDIKELINNYANKESTQESLKLFVESKGYDSSYINDNIKNKLFEDVLADYSAKHLSNYDIDYKLPDEIAYRVNTLMNDAINTMKINKNATAKDINNKDIVSITNQLEKQMLPKYSDIENKNITEQLPTANKETITNNKTLKGDVLPKYNDGMKVENTNKILNPNEISKLTKIDANTTPKLPTVNRNKVNDGNSKFWDNINDKTNMLDEKQKQLLLTDEEVKYYDTITNKQSLETAFKRLESNGTHETENWFSKKSENATAIDVAEGWILLKQYSDSGDTDGMVAVAKKMRDMGTKAGQTVQAFNIMERMTPEGMVKYAQTELSEAYDKMVKNKSKDWINKYRSDFDLTPNEVQFIMDNMKAISKMEDGYDKRVKLAEIQKVLTDKLPPERGAGTKAWMRISMLFNPKTQVRNVMGNAIITPVNYFSDLFASGVDKIISKKTGVRTTGVTNVKNYAKGFKQGLYESYNDFKKGINTRNLEGNRFEVTEGKSFNNKTFIGKNLNRVDNLLGFMLDAGDRGFYEATFTNSINNQKVLNNTDNVTQEMIDIATKEALSRTWQDNNGYTNFVLNIRKGLNKINVKGYGLGDVLIPFAKTPANLTKAIVDYSPAGLVNALIAGKNLLRSFGNGQYNSNLQYDFVQNLGKATAGSMLYVLGYALAKAGIISGDSDDDKDVSNFMKNTLGISSYSIKIGGKNFTYDWAQPIAAPLSIMANYVQKQKDNPNANTLENIISSLDVAGNILLEQSFMDSINTVLNNNDGFVSGLQESVMELPSRAIPTLMKQIVDLTDSTQRQTYTYDKPLETMKNKVIAKIPGLSKSLAPSVDTLGREIQRYGGKNNIFNVFFNPANVNTENISESAKEIYKIYKSTGDSAVMPKQVAYYINKDGEKIVLTNEQRAEYQKISGELIEKSVSKTMKQSSYQNMDDELKADTLSNIVNYSYEIAKSKVLNQEVGNTYKTAYEYSKIGDVGDYYSFKESIDDTDKDTKRKSITNFLINSSLNDEQLAFLYGNYYSSEDTLDLISNFEIPMKEFIKYNSQGFENEYNADGTISNSKKNQILNYINSLNLNVAQKAILYKMKYSSYSKYDNAILTYINKLDLSKFEKSSLAKQLGFSYYDDYLISYIKTLNISEDDKIKQLKSLGFTVYTSNGKTYVKKG